MGRDVDWRHLHPQFRVLTEELSHKASVLRLKRYEGARSPHRQVELYARGRTAGEIGKTVTRAKAWESKHQYGFADDYVFFIDGRWTWAEPHKGAWQEFQDMAKAIGLKTLSFEKPHVEFDISLTDLQAGRYPGNGDEFWEQWIETEIENWGHESRLYAGITHPGAPPSPTVGDRPTEEHWEVIA